MRAMLWLVLAGAASGETLIEGMKLSVGPKTPDAGCVVRVDDVALSRAEPCTVTRLDEQYAVGAVGQATFVARSEAAYGGRLVLKPGSEVKAHQHDTSVEVVVITSGRGTFVLDGGTREVGAGDTIVIPRAMQHAFFAGPAAVKAVQFYLPPGPELRFRPQEKKP